MTMQRICVIIPGYNVANTIGPLIQRVRAIGLDVVMVDDGSTDRTAPVATEAGARVISHVHNQGKGSALRTGFSYALQTGYSLVVTLDSDGQHDPADIPRLLAAAQQPQAGLVIGNRLNGAATEMPRLRRWTNRLMSQVVSAVAHRTIPDSQSGFRAIPNALLTSVALSTHHFEIETELVLAASRAGWPVTSVPIRVIYDQHRSRIHPVRDGWRFLCLVLRYCWPGAHTARHAT
jgi:glycosyltransferase involved in cell wall biosynthesis